MFLASVDWNSKPKSRIQSLSSETFGWQNSCCVHIVSETAGSASTTGREEQEEFYNEKNFKSLQNIWKSFCSQMHIFFLFSHTHWKWKKKSKTRCYGDMRTIRAVKVIVAGTQEHHNWCNGILYLDHLLWTYLKPTWCPIACLKQSPGNFTLTPQY